MIYRKSTIANSQWEKGIQKGIWFRVWTSSYITLSWETPFPLPENGYFSLNSSPIKLDFRLATTNNLGQLGVVVMYFAVNLPRVRDKGEIDRKSWTCKRQVDHPYRLIYHALIKDRNNAWSGENCCLKTITFYLISFISLLPYGLNVFSKYLSYSWTYFLNIHPIHTNLNATNSIWSTQVGRHQPYSCDYHPVLEL